MLSVHSRSSCLYSKDLFLQVFATQATSLTQILLEAERASIRTNHRHTPATKTLPHLHSWGQCPRRTVFHRGPLISSHWEMEIQNVSHTCGGEGHEAAEGAGLTSRAQFSCYAHSSTIFPPGTPPGQSPSLQFAEFTT